MRPTLAASTRTTLLMLACLAMAAPFLWMAATSLMGQLEVFSSGRLLQGPRDDVALDLRRAAGDRSGLAPEPLPLPVTVTGRIGRARRERSGGTDHLQRSLGEVLGHPRPLQLDPTRLGTGLAAASEPAEHAPVVHAEHAELDEGLRQGV